MKLTGKLKTQADYAAMKEEKKEIDKKASIRLTDDELDQVAGGFGHRRDYCVCFVPLPDGNGFCEQCGGEILQ